MNFRMQVIACVLEKTKIKGQRDIVHVQEDRDSEQEKDSCAMLASRSRGQGTYPEERRILSHCCRCFASNLNILEVVSFPELPGELNPANTLNPTSMT
jgi:hypothetical protein